MRRRRSTKIVATLGPATATPEKIAALFEAGVDVFRLNFSHGTQSDHKARLDTVRALEKTTGRPIGIMADLQGPKLRVGTFAGGRVRLADGAAFRLDLDKAPGDAQRASLPHPEVFAALTPETDLLLDDGNIRLRVEKCDKDFAQTRVINGGNLSDRKGVNVPNAVLPLSPLTAKDRADMAFALDMGADWIALSFVQRPEDVAEARKLIGNRAGVLIKLEKPAAITKLTEIIELSDAVMVARGDLGVEMPPEDVPPLQRRIVGACRAAGKPVVVATQMLESMMRVPVPTRAEASDVATAVYEGADAVMLSAESASGEYPVEAVKMMDRIIRRVQADPAYFSSLHASAATSEHTPSDAISAAAGMVAHTIGAAAIMSYTTSGATALRAARERPDVPVIALTSNLSTARRLAITWGLHCVHTADVNNFTDMVQKATQTARGEGFAEKGERVVITAGVPFGTPGATNVLRIAWIDG
ncbi:MAG: pyruvate kinase [Alphaproteobacteria bacterium]|nr:pyruvate kinase [Alphaproteobacteria bacterium]MDE1931471.1 pyruvate kinase [Alphaproteobacteria bacterium]